MSVTLIRMPKVLSALALAALLAQAAAAQGASTAPAYKVGFVSVERIVKESAPAKNALAKISGEFSKRQAEVETAAAKLKTAYDQFEKDGPVLADAERARRQRDLQDQERELQRLRRAFTEDLNQRQNEEVASVVEQANKVVRQIAQSENYDLIVQDAVFVGPRVDLTERVLKELASAPAR